MTIVAAILDLYTNTILFGFSIGELLTGLYPAQQLDAAAEYVGHPSPENAGVADVLLFTLSS